MTETSARSDGALFQWRIQGRLMVFDSGAQLTRQDNFSELMALDGFNVVTFDPASRVPDPKALPDDNMQYFAHVALGDGQPGTLYACLDADWSATLEPLPADCLPKAQQDDARVLARLPVNTVALDAIDGLLGIDWLLLDACNDSLAILCHGETALAHVLLYQVRLPFVPTHRGQADFVRINRWMRQHGFVFYRVHNFGYRSHLPAGVALEKEQASQMTGVDALFVPNEARIDCLDSARREKLAFLLDTVYGIHDLSYQIIARDDETRAGHYLLSHGYISAYDDEPDTFTLIAAYSPAP